MIVYSGKQRGNNFNNGDEALFQDANRPRDNDKFKIKPGLQSDKWDFRSSNKNINTRAAELKVHGAISATSGTTYLYPERLIQDEKIGDPGCIITDDGKLEIIEDGTYIIQATCQFRYASTPNNGHYSIENVALLKRKDNGGFVYQSKAQGRVCANTSDHADWLTTLYTGWVTKGTVFTVGACFSYTGVTITIYESISVQRLA